MPLFQFRNTFEWGNRDGGNGQERGREASHTLKIMFNKWHSGLCLNNGSNIKKSKSKKD